MENKQTAMQDFLIHIREKKNIITRDWQNRHADYYVVRIFEMLEAECFSRLEKEKEQIKNAWIDGDESDCLSEQDNQLFAEEYYNKTYGKE